LGILFSLLLFSPEECTISSGEIRVQGKSAKPNIEADLIEVVMKPVPSPPTSIHGPTGSMKKPL